MYMSCARESQEGVDCDACESAEWYVACDAHETAEVELLRARGGGEARGGAL